jgi:hypothetical protein
VWLARICLVAADDEAECAGEMGQMGVTLVISAREITMSDLVVDRVHA